MNNAFATNTETAGAKPPGVVSNKVPTLDVKNPMAISIARGCDDCLAS
ncbi:MAG: hypothetical protein IIC60_13525 [Proteobacteria bacterium]|nr:hypothetical protein [Pseudomonadota bacterium]